MACAVTCFSFRKELYQLGRRIFTHEIVLRSRVGNVLAHRDDGIHENRKVGPAAQAVDRIDRGWTAFVKVRVGRRREVSAGRKTHDADPRGSSSHSFAWARTVRIAR